MKSLKGLIKPLLDLVFPDLCFHCKSRTRLENNPFCLYCYSSLPFTDLSSLKQDDFVLHFKQDLNLIYALSLFELNPGSAVAQIIHQLKYSERPFLGVELGKLYAEILIVTMGEFKVDYILPVPLHKKKLRKRGYNQSERIAFGLSKTLSVPIDQHLIRRKINTPSQTKLSRVERFNNTKNAFELLKPLEKDKHYLLVDDVLTTGATLSGCAQALKNGGATKVSMLTIALGN